MARQKKVAEPEALMAAMMLFWRVGFHGAGTRQIEEETGITRFTLQTSYGGKKALFLAALDHYLGLFDVYLLPPLRSGALEDIAGWVEEFPVPESMAEARCNGCMMINAIAEFASSDADVTARADQFYLMMRGAFCDGLQRAAQSGALKPGIVPKDAAEVVLANVIALHIANRSQAPHAGADSLAKSAGALIRSWAA